MITDTYTDISSKQIADAILFIFFCLVFKYMNYLPRFSKYFINKIPETDIPINTRIAVRSMFSNKCVICASKFLFYLDY